MTCEEFELAGLDLETIQEDDPVHYAAREHLRSCPRCAALHEDWQKLRADLHAVGAETQEAEAPARVEMRLRQEYRTRHKTLKMRRAAVYAGWTLAAAAVVVAAVSWVNWRHGNGQGGTLSAVNSAQNLNMTKTTPAGPELGETIVASNDAGEFTLLPGSLPGMLGDATVVRVQMQRGALGALGLTVNEERAADLIQVDLLVGDDGQPQALRLAETTN
jgi:predicted anti-sigma-YlaC factor YlaD